MPSLRTYEEFSAGEDDFDSLVQGMPTDRHDRRRDGAAWVFNRRRVAHPHLTRVELRVSPPSSGRSAVEVSLWCSQPRPAEFKRLFRILRRRAITVTHDGDRYTLRCSPLEDRSIQIGRSVAMSPRAAAELYEVLETDWESVYAAVVAELGRNQRRHRRNMDRVSRFFNNRAAFAAALAPVARLCGGVRVEQSQGRQITPTMRALSPVVRFTYDLPSSNVMSRSDKHLLLTRDTLSVIRCLAIGAKRVLSAAPGAAVRVYMDDRSVWVTCRSDDPGTLSRWAGQEDSFIDNYHELEGICQSSFVQRATDYTKGRGIEFAGWEMQFRFAATIAQVRQTYRIRDAIPVMQGATEPAAVRALMAAVDACAEMPASYPGHECRAWAADGRIVVEVSLAVDATWQDTTVSEQGQDEGDLDDEDDLEED